VCVYSVHTPNTPKTAPGLGDNVCPRWDSNQISALVNTGNSRKHPESGPIRPIYGPVRSEERVQRTHSSFCPFLSPPRNRRASPEARWLCFVPVVVPLKITRHWGRMMAKGRPESSPERRGKLSDCVRWTSRLLHLPSEASCAKGRDSHDSTTGSTALER
jgi:hypothetical protein